MDRVRCDGSREVQFTEFTLKTIDGMKLSAAALKAADKLMPIDLAEKPDPAIHRRQRDAMARVIQAAIDEETRALRSRLERADRVIAEVGVMAHDFDQLGPADDHRFEKIVETIREFAG